MNRARNVEDLRLQLFGVGERLPHIESEAELVEPPEVVEANPIHADERGGIGDGGGRSHLASGESSGHVLTKVVVGHHAGDRAPGVWLVDKLRAETRLIEVGEVTVAVLLRTPGAGQVAHRTIERLPGGLGVYPCESEAPAQQLQLTAWRLTACFARHHDDPARLVAVEGGRRAAQHLDAGNGRHVEVGEVLAGTTGIVLRHAVDHQADAAHPKGVGRARAADRNGHARRASELIPHDESGNGSQRFLDVGVAPTSPLNDIQRHDADGGGDVRQLLATSARGDDHLAENRGRLDKCDGHGRIATARERDVSDVRQEAEQRGAESEAPSG